MPFCQFVGDFFGDVCAGKAHNMIYFCLTVSVWSGPAPISPVVHHLSMVGSTGMLLYLVIFLCLSIDVLWQFLTTSYFVSSFSMF